ncbi:MAG: hypothetical protein ACK4PR_06645, partial [Gammaproteobacteria bacterium]
CTKDAKNLINSTLLPATSITESIWLVYLLRKKNKEHAYLFVEGIFEEQKIFVKADLLICPPPRNDFSLALLINKVFPAAFIRLERMEGIRLENYLDPQQSEYISWRISPKQAESVLSRLCSETNKLINYNKPGNSFLYASSYSCEEYDNCISWCLRILEEVIGEKNKNKWQPVQYPSSFIADSIEKNIFKKR